MISQANPTGGSAQSRARYFNSGNAFNIKRPPVPAAVFVDEFDAMSASEITGTFACDQAEALGTPFPATTPLMLARYATIAPNDALRTTFVATGVIWFVIAGSGYATVGTERFAWDSGDVFLTPGGVETLLEARGRGAKLWLVTNEPQLSFDRLVPSVDANGPIEVVHYTADDIARELQRVTSAGGNDATAGIALIFSAEREEASRNIMPSLTLSLNTVPPGEHQRTHRHNSAAVTLILQGRDCYSLVGAIRCAWSNYATLVTPATEPHSHHNESAERALFLIVQDGGLHYYTRTMGFTFLETPTVS